MQNAIKIWIEGSHLILDLSGHLVRCPADLSSFRVLLETLKARQQDSKIKIGEPGCPTNQEFIQQRDKFLQNRAEKLAIDLKPLLALGLKIRKF